MCFEPSQKCGDRACKMCSTSLPGDRSLFWLAERDRGRLWRNRFIRLNPMGMSASDMVSKDSADAKESLAAWSASPDWVDWECRGLRLCGAVEHTETHNNLVRGGIEAERMDLTGLMD